MAAEQINQIIYDGKLISYIDDGCKGPIEAGKVTTSYYNPILHERIEYDQHYEIICRVCGKNLTIVNVDVITEASK